jgi:hypothetical protein
MTPATAELQARSLAIALEATHRALAQPPRRTMPWPPDEEQPRDPELPPEDPDEDDELPEFVRAHGREDDSPYACLTCEDEGGWYEGGVILDRWVGCPEPGCPARQRRREEAEDGAVEFGRLPAIGGAR